MAPKTAQMGHEAEENTTQALMIAYSVENSEVRGILLGSPTSSLPGAFPEFVRARCSWRSS